MTNTPDTRDLRLLRYRRFDLTQRQLSSRQKICAQIITSAGFVMRRHNVGYDVSTQVFKRGSLVAELKTIGEAQAFANAVVACLDV